MTPVAVGHLQQGWKEEDGGNGSALRIRPEPSKLRNDSQKQPYILSLVWSMLAQPNPEVEDTDSSSPIGDNTIGPYRPKLPGRKQQSPLYPWWLPRLKYVPVSQQGYSWKGEGNPGGVG